MNRTPEPGASPPLRLELPTPFPVGTVNAYFLAGAEPTLIDPGLASAESLEALRRQLAQHGHSLDEVRRILVTHGHLDHAGAAQRLSRQCRAVLCRHRQETLLAHGLPELVARRQAFLGRCGLPEATAREAVAALRPGHTPADLEVEPWAVELLQGGESVPAGAGVLGLARWLSQRHVSSEDPRPLGRGGLSRPGGAGARPHDAPRLRAVRHRPARDGRLRRRPGPAGG